MVATSFSGLVEGAGWVSWCEGGEWDWGPTGSSEDGAGEEDGGEEGCEAHFGGC